MPNRIIKESIRTSKSINGLTDFQFRLWAYLITYVDDYGRGSADPEILKGFVFPRRKSVTEATIAKGLTDLATTGLIRLYEVDGDSYLCFPTWAEHQRIQQKRSKYPGPDEESQKVTVGHGESPPESESESESKSNPNPEECVEQQGGSPPSVILFPLNDGSEFPITQEQVREWEQLYPAVDVMQQLRSMRGWLLSNPKKRKTRRGILTFASSWLGREQDKGGNRKGTGSARKNSDSFQTGNPFMEMLEEERGR